MSQYLENLKIGETVDFRGPSGRLIYKGHGNFSVKILRKDPPTKYNVKKVCILNLSYFLIINFKNKKIFFYCIVNIDCDASWWNRNHTNASINSCYNKGFY